MKKQELLIGIENIEENFKMLDNIFKTMPIYFKGETSDAITELYGLLKEDISKTIDFMSMIKASMGVDDIKKLPGDIL